MHISQSSRTKKRSVPSGVYRGNIEGLSWVLTGDVGLHFLVGLYFFMTKNLQMSKNCCNFAVKHSEHKTTRYEKRNECLDHGGNEEP
jgi:hypothetical protein